MCCVSWPIPTSENYPKCKKLMVALFVCTRHIPPYTTLYRHMTVYDGICRARDIMLSGFQMFNPEDLDSNRASEKTSISNVHSISKSSISESKNTFDIERPTLDIGARGAKDPDEMF